MHERVRTLGLLVNPVKAQPVSFVLAAEKACRDAGIELMPGPMVEAGSLASYSLEDMKQHADAMLVLGGDGTILHAVGDMMPSPLPVLGINLGTLGFLAECAPEALPQAIERLATGDFRLEQRMLLEASVQGEPHRFTALNDIVVSRGSFARMVQAEAFVDSHLATRFAGDGCVIATPTGSTAYSLSAGGPIVSPGLSCFVIAPICPHTLSSRPMVIPAEATLRIALATRADLDGGMLLCVDGTQRLVLRETTVLTIKRCAQSLSFIRFGADRFFHNLRAKLTQWGEEPPFDSMPRP